jgi:hypothetical protein
MRYDCVIVELGVSIVLKSSRCKILGLIIALCSVDALVESHSLLYGMILAAVRHTFVPFLEHNVKAKDSSHGPGS